MQEDFLHYIWKHKAFSSIALKTTKGEDSTVKGESNTEMNPGTKEGDQQKEEDEDEEKIENGVKEDNGSKSDDAVFDDEEAASGSSAGGIKFPNLPLDVLAKALADNVQSPSPSPEKAKEDAAAASPPPRAGESPNMPISSRTLPLDTLPLDALAAAAKVAKAGSSCTDEDKCFIQNINSRERMRLREKRETYVFDVAYEENKEKGEATFDSGAGVSVWPKGKLKEVKMLPKQKGMRMKAANGTEIEWGSEGY